MKRFCLALFFTRGVSLKTWEDNGSLHREVAVYQRLHQQGIKAIFVTYGGQRDLEISRNLHGVKVLCNPGICRAGCMRRLFLYCFGGICEMRTL